MTNRLDDHLMQAVVQEQPDKVRDLIRAGADPNVKAESYHAMPGYMDQETCRPLTSASQCGCVENARVLLEAGADPSADKSVALVRAISYSHKLLIKMLIDHGVNLHEYYVGTSALGSKPDREIIDMLLDAGMRGVIPDQEMEIDAYRGQLAANYELRIPMTPSKALILAAANGKVEAVQDLLGRGAKPDSAGRALFCALENGHTSVVESLVAVTPLEADYGVRALTVAIDQDDDVMLEFLWQHYPILDLAEQKRVARYAIDQKRQRCADLFKRWGIEGGAGAELFDFSSRRKLK